MEENKEIEMLGNTAPLEPIVDAPPTEPVPTEVPVENVQVEAPAQVEIVEAAPTEPAPVETPAEPAPVPVVEAAPVPEVPAAEPTITPTEPTTPPSEPTPAEPVTPAPEEPKKKKGKGGLILIIILLLALAGFAVWYFVLGGNGSKKEEPKKEEEQQEEKKEEKKENEKEEEEEEEPKEEETKPEEEPKEDIKFVEVTDSKDKITNNDKTYAIDAVVNEKESYITLNGNKLIDLGLGDSLGKVFQHGNDVIINTHGTDVRTYKLYIYSLDGNKIKEIYELDDNKMVIGFKGLGDLNYVVHDDYIEFAGTRLTHGPSYAATGEGLCEEQQTFGGGTIPIFKDDSVIGEASYKLNGNYEIEIIKGTEKTIGDIKKEVCN